MSSYTTGMHQSRSSCKIGTARSGQHAHACLQILDLLHRLW